MRICQIRLFLFFVTVLFAIPAFPFSSNHWQYISGRHFDIAYNEETAHLAVRALSIAEQINERIVEYFGYPDRKTRVTVVLSDDNDIPNGLTDALRPLVKVDCRRVPLLWRAQHDWLLTVLSHEISHAYSLAVMRVPLVILGKISWHAEPDYNDGDFESYFDHRPLPVWLIEGLAQAGSQKVGAEHRDAFREMLLRDALYSNRLLSLQEMSRFEGTSRESELAYNQGYDLVGYLERSNTNIEIKKLCRSIRNVGFSAAVELHVDKPLREIYTEWRQSLDTRFSTPPKPVNGHRVFSFSDSAALRLETGCAAHGRYAIANWQHDYDRFDLFDMSIPQHPRCIAHETGPYICFDAPEKTLWFTRLVHNARSGTAGYELFALPEDGKARRITHDARCIAFDVKQGMAVYAIYEQGTTSIMRRMPDGAQSALCVFPYDTSVDRISIASTDSIILSLGTATGNRIALLRHQSIKVLWPEIDADIMDAEAKGTDTLIFVSTVDATPQLYWCDIVRNPAQWHRITDAFGIRFPQVEENADSTVVYCSVYGNGHYTTYELHDVFDEQTPILLDAGADIIRDRVYPEVIDTVSLGLKPITTSMPLALPVYRFGYLNESYKYSMADTILKRSGPYAGASMIFENGPQSFHFGLDTEVRLFPSQENIPVSLLVLGVNVGKDIGPVRFHGDYFAQRNFRILYDDPDQYSYQKITERTLELGLGYELTRRQTLAMRYLHQAEAAFIKATLKNPEYRYRETNSRTIEFDLGTYYRSKQIAVAWDLQEFRSRIDPAHLGVPFAAIHLAMEVRGNEYPVKNDTLYFFDTASYKLSALTVTRPMASLSARTMLWESKLSVCAIADGFIFIGGSTAQKIWPNIWEILGTEDLFSGYPWGYLRVIKMGRIHAQVRCNPFIRTQDKTPWYERLHIGLKGEYGLVQHFGDTQSWALPLSVEASLQHWWYLRPSHQSSWYLRFAVPVVSIPGADKRLAPRWYAGLQL